MISCSHRTLRFMGNEASSSPSLTFRSLPPSVPNVLDFFLLYLGHAMRRSRCTSFWKFINFFHPCSSYLKTRAARLLVKYKYEQLIIWNGHWRYPAAVKSARDHEIPSSVSRICQSRLVCIAARHILGNYRGKSKLCGGKIWIGCIIKEHTSLLVITLHTCST